MSTKHLKHQRIFLILILLFSSLNYAQEYHDFLVKGSLIDDNEKPLESATIYIEEPNGTLVDYTLSNQEGGFEIAGKVQNDSLFLFVSYTGFLPIKQLLDLKKQSNWSFNNLQMKIDDQTLEEVLVQAQAAPVTVKTDTLEFNAASFKTKANANLEDVLKKLPGVSVNNAGEISINGKPVSKILVNGKSFFSDDPKIATKNLPKELINKIQVVDTKTKTEEFTGKEGDSQNKTLNITIDEDKNRGYFARITAGIGTQNRYEASGIANYFKNSFRLSVLGGSNNINSSGFSFDEIYDAMGRNAYSISRSSNGSFSINGNSFGGGNSGITQTYNTGFSLVNEWEERTELETDYFFNRSNTETKTKINRENILPDRIFFNESSSISKRENDNHRASFDLSFRPDSLTRISFRPNFSYNKGRSQSDSETKSFQEDFAVLNQAETRNDTEVEQLNFAARLGASRRLDTLGSYVNLNLNYTNNTTDNQQLFYSLRQIFDDNGGVSDTDLQDQRIKENTDAKTFNTGLGARIALRKKIFLDVEYTLNYSKSINERLVYDNSTKDFLLDLSNDFKTSSLKHRPSLGMVYRSKKLRASLSAGVEQLNLTNKDHFSGNRFESNFTNFYSNFYLRYKINQAASVYFNYESQQNAPSINQLQPVENRTNPLNIIQGNPNLKPNLTHNFYFSFNNYNYKTKSGLYTYAGADFIQDKVTSISQTNEELIRETSYTNVNGAYSAFIGANYSFLFSRRDFYDLKLRLGLSGAYSRDVGFSNAVEFVTKDSRLSPSIKLDVDFTDILQLTPYYELNLRNAKYSLPTRNNERFVNHEIGVEVTSFWPKNLIFGNDIAYQRLGNVSPGFTNNFILWNMSLGYQFFDEKATFKVKVFDVLDQNIATRRQTGEDFIQDTQELVLERYLMFSLTFKLDKFGKNKG
ncbi:outer membrane beta-barrel protein [Mesonia sediminis]|uniref:Outer membrane beta-barrel protein n=1 Tax=Mesonia sediminis TaxID=1703946 RepID=A0ABW5SB41_9FLAO